MPPTLYQYNMYQNRITVVLHKNLYNCNFNGQEKEFMPTQTACEEPSKGHEDGSSGGPEDNLFDR